MFRWEARQLKEQNSNAPRLTDRLCSLRLRVKSFLHHSHVNSTFVIISPDYMELGGCQVELEMGRVELPSEKFQVQAATSVGHLVDNTAKLEGSESHLEAATCSSHPEPRLPEHEASSA